MPDRILDSERLTDDQKYDVVRQRKDEIYGIPIPPVIEEGQVLEGQQFPARSVINGSSSSPEAADTGDKQVEIVSKEVLSAPSRFIPVYSIEVEKGRFLKKLVNRRSMLKTVSKAA